jgi:transposase InsO family protein
MNKIEFEIWLANSGISDDGKTIIKKIRSSPPVRNVQGGASNVIGPYPSRKMGMGIQFESHTVELAFINEYEFDDDVLEYYDQPGPIHIEYVGKKDRKVAVYTTPDFFVIRKNGIAGWEECKTLKELESFEKKSTRFTRVDGEWRSLPSEKYAESYGLYFRVRSSDKINWFWQRNIEYLSDFLQNESPDCDPKIVSVATALVKFKQGILLSELLAHTQLFSPDDIFTLIARGELYVNLLNSVVSEHERVHVYSDELHSKLSYQTILPPETTTMISIEPGETLLWDGKPFIIVNVADKLWIKDGNNPPVQLSKAELEYLVKNNQIKGVKQNTSDGYVLKQLLEASSEEYDIANARMRKISIFLEGRTKELKTTRSIRDWLKRYRDAERNYGYGYIGLLRKTKERGNREAKLPARAKEIMVESINEFFLANVQRRIISVYGEYCIKCEDENVIPASLRTFSKYRYTLDIQETEESRKGKRAAYQIGMFYWSIEQTTPRHGTRPFEIAHLDHTELDIELLHSKTFENQGRPWLTLLTDAYSRRVLAFCVSYEPPSYRSCMLVMKDCVRRYNRLPQTIVVDNGAEFGSTYFETLLAMYVITKKTRPPAEPRFGSVLERMFGITNTMFIHALRGNTQIMKEIRMVTKGVNPANNAVWTLSYLMERIEKFYFEVFDCREHPALGESPRNAYETGMAIHGMRSIRMINFDEVFRFSIMPSTNKGTAKVIISRGIKIHNIYYWHPTFRAIPGEIVSVKYDPYNIGFAYAYKSSSKKWVECTSEYHPALKGLTEKELKVISTQIRRQKQLTQKRVTVTARDVARFLQESRLIEEELIESRKAAEMRKAGVFDETLLDDIENAVIISPEQLPITKSTETYEELTI